MTVTTLDDARNAILVIPAISNIYNSSHQAFLDSLLEKFAVTVDGTKYYRIYATSASYLKLHPNFWIKKHDRTEMNSIEGMLEEFGKLQSQEDLELGIDLTQDPGEMMSVSMLSKLGTWDKKL